MTAIHKTPLPQADDAKTVAARYQPSASLLAKAAAMELAHKRIERLTEQVDVVAAQIKEIDAEVVTMTAERDRLTAELVMADDSELKKVEAAENRLNKELDEKVRTQARLKQRIVAFEDMAPALDQDVVNSAAALEAVVREWMDGVKQSLGQELAEASTALLGIMAKARAVGELDLKDFFEAAWLPDTRDFQYPWVSGGYHVAQGTNLLKRDPSPEEAAHAAELQAKIDPIRMLVRRGKSRFKYVSLAEREREAARFKPGPPKGKVVEVAL